MGYFFIMARSINSSKLDKAYILSKVSQVTIFSTYLNLSDALVKNCIDTGELIISPLREDSHPTCGFRYDSKNRLKFKDFAGYFWGDCFDVVALVMSNMYNIQIDISNKHDFIKILRHITLVFKDIFYGEEKDINLITEINTTIVNIKKRKQKIEIVVRDWNINDENYWKSFGIPLQFLNINYVYPVEQFYIDRTINPQPKYYYNVKDPCYAYLLGRDRSGVDNIKLYFPKRDHATTRFITNCNHLEGIYNLPDKDYDVIIVTKSSKDRLSIGATLYMSRFLYREGIKAGVINIPHETYRLRQNEYDWLKSKLKVNGHIVSLMDNDRVGKAEAIWLRNNFAIIPVIIPNNTGCKDFAELRQKTDSKTIYNMLVQTKNYIKDYNGERIIQYLRNEAESSSLPY